MSGTSMVSSPSHGQEDAHIRKYSILPLSPELVVTVTSIHLPTPAQRRLVRCWEFSDYHFGVIKTSLINIFSLDLQSFVS